MTAKKSPFPFVGGKARYVDTILDLLPEHRCYVEVFGGSAAVLMQKEKPLRSKGVEVYNDADEHLVNFFEVLRDESDELVESLRHRPYSRELYETYSSELYGDETLPDDDVERAARFFYLRYAQFGAKYHGKSGFAISKTKNRAEGLINAREALESFAVRLSHVVIENLDWRDCFDRYDAAETVFYLDPPYIGDDRYIEGDDFSHDEFVSRIAELEAYWVLSYSELPNGLDEYLEKEIDATFMLSSGKAGKSSATSERFLTNFDVRDKSDDEQTTLGSAKSD